MSKQLKLQPLSSNSINSPTHSRSNSPKNSPFQNNKSRSTSPLKSSLNSPFVRSKRLETTKPQPFKIFTDSEYLRDAASSPSNTDHNSNDDKENVLQPKKLLDPQMARAPLHELEITQYPGYLTTEESTRLSDKWLIAPEIDPKANNLPNYITPPRAKVDKYIYHTENTSSSRINGDPRKRLSVDLNQEKLKLIKKPQFEIYKEEQ